MLKFLDFLQSLMLERKDLPESQRGIIYMRRVWFTENNVHQTPLQLAACLGEDEIFTYIMGIRQVYCFIYGNDGLFEGNKYDMTEMDTLTNLDRLQRDRNASIWFKTSLLMRRSSPAILDTVCRLDVNAACRIIKFPVLQTLLDGKWKHYKKYFIAWGLLHFLIGCISLSIYAHYKIRYNNWLNDESTSTNKAKPANDTTEKSFNKPTISQSHELFVMISCCLLFGPALLALSLEFIRTFVQRRPWNLLIVHHNGTYRLVHLLLYLCVFVDGIWFLVSPSTNPNVIIVLAVLLSWCFLMFFLRPFKTFSFYTVMLQKVLIGDMLRFSAFILLELVSFTVVMQMLFLHNQPVADEFRDFPNSLLTMFRLMLGLEDIDILSKADPEWLAILLFVTYVLITYVMLVNSLIAMMSNTCSAIQLDKDNIWQVQRLSVILFMEHLLMIFGLARTLGERHYVLLKNKLGPKDTSDGASPVVPEEDSVDGIPMQMIEKDHVDGRYMEMTEGSPSVGTRYVIEVSDGLTPSVRVADIARQRRYMREK